MKLRKSKRPLPTKSTPPATQRCTGACANLFLLLLQTVEFQTTSASQQQPPILHTEPAHSLEAVYKPLLVCQTRLLRLPPRSSSPNAFAVELVAVDLLATLGARTVDDKQYVEYTALSYTWEDDSTENGTILCNGIRISLPGNVIAAIRFHQSHDTVSYLWIDAICINQGDHQEKVAQIGIMLDIFRNAQEVTAWLGPSDASSDLVQECLQHCDALQQALVLASSMREHLPSCLQTLQHVFSLFLAFYERPYFGRTWIRQETFAARHLAIVCGTSSAHWNLYAVGAALLLSLHRVIAPLTPQVESRYLQVLTWIDDVLASRDNRTSIWPLPRDIVGLLASSKSYGVTIEQDTVYALLRMAGIQTTGDSAGWSFKDSKFLIDYNRPVEQVYFDLNLWLLKDNNRIPTWWNLYVRPAGHALPRWLMHWRHSRCSNLDLQAIESCLGQGRGAGEEGPTSRWCPIRRPSNHDAPRIHNEDKSTLVLNGRALNYVACVTEYTCSMEEFIHLSKRPEFNLVLGAAATKIHHAAHRPQDVGLFSFPPDTRLQKYDEQQHDRKVAILGCALDWQLALVPATTKKGDLVVGIAPGLLPMVLSPRQSDTYHGSLYATPDTYEDCLYTTLEKRTSPWHLYISSELSSSFDLINVAILCLSLFLVFMTIFLTGGDLDVFHYIIVGFIWCMGAILIITLNRMQRATSTDWQRVKTPDANARTRIFGILDQVSEEHSPHYDFVGPVLVRQGGPSKLYANPRLYVPFGDPRDRPVQTFYLH